MKRPIFAYVEKLGLKLFVKIEFVLNGWKNKLEAGRRIGTCKHPG